VDTDADRDCWLHEKVEVRDSPIAGCGLFTTVAMMPGVVMAILCGRLVSDATLRTMLEHANGTYTDTVSLHENVNLVLPAGTPLHWGNHSCDPNLWWVDPLSLATRRHVAAGAELTVDYGTLTDSPDFEMECNCEASMCRQHVTGADWQRSDLQEAYGDHWVPVLRHRLRDLQQRQ
jgi:hypothetical protein